MSETLDGNEREVKRDALLARLAEHYAFELLKTTRRIRERMAGEGDRPLRSLRGLQGGPRRRGELWLVPRTRAGRGASG